MARHDSPTSKKKGNCFVCGKPGHHAPKCRRRVKNDNPSKANIVEGDDAIVAIVSLPCGQCEYIGGKL